MTRNLTCIICPRGCSLTVNQDEKGITVTGFSCPKGEKYAIDECTNPVRTVTSTVRVGNRKDTMVSVKTAAPVPKGSMADVMTILRNITVSAPVAIGDVIASDVFGTTVVATKAID